MWSLFELKNGEEKALEAHASRFQALAENLQGRQGRGDRGDFGQLVWILLFLRGHNQ